MTTIDIPDNWLPTSENINALPRPLRDLFMRLHANTDPAGELQRAMIAEMERDAMRKMIEEAPEGRIDQPVASDAVIVDELPPGFYTMRGKRVKLLEVE